MTSALPKRGKQLRSTLHRSGELELSLSDAPVQPPGPDEVVVRVEATPINPSDIGLLLGPVDPSTLQRRGQSLVGPVHPRALPAFEARVDHPMPVGNEGAGEVIAAGEHAAALLGKKVSLSPGGMYAQFRTVNAREVVPLPEGASAADGASAFVNPMTALAMVETLRLEQHTALVHTAAASQLGQMLVRICKQDGIPLVNVVRKPEQVALLEALGAEHVVDSSQPDFEARLTEAIAATGATLGFDATGGGPLAGQLLAAMERALVRKLTTFSRYGSPTHKQVYIYGALDLSPTVLPRTLGLAWGLDGFLVSYFLARQPMERVQAMRARVGRELKTTFKSHYSRTISLEELLQVGTARAWAARATGEKYLVDPTR